MKIEKFEDILSWQKSRVLAHMVYRSFDNSKDSSFKNQIERASISVMNNIAEGFERETKKELIRFLYFSKGSAGECRNMFNFLKLLEYINEENFYNHRNDVLEISKQLGNYIKYLKNLEKQNKKS